MILPKTIFRAYDIRGIYPTDLDGESSEYIGKALGTHLIRKSGDSSLKIVVGRDSRSSSPELSQKFISGVISTGCSVVDVGVSLTPVIHFLTCTGDFDAGVEITASHNPKEYNGFRIDYKSAAPFEHDDILNLHSLIEKEDFEVGKGAVEEKDMFPEYLNHIKENFSFDSKLKVVVDCGYGTTSYFAEQIFDSVGIDAKPFTCTPDDDFPRGIPNPERSEFMKGLSDKVLELKADVGFAFDEDSDRFGVVDEKGGAYDNDRLLLLFASHLLKKNPGALVISDVKSSNLVGELVEKWGGKYEMVPTGHTYFVKKMKGGAQLGGEFSGHVYFGNGYFGYDDGIFAACKVLEILVDGDKALSKVMSEFPARVGTHEIKVKCDDSKKFDVVESVKEEVLSKKGEFLEIITIDGVRVSVTGKAWFLIRASNTSPNLSIRVEAEDKKELELLLEGVADLLKPYDLDISPLENSF